MLVAFQRSGDSRGGRSGVSPLSDRCGLECGLLQRSQAFVLYKPRYERVLKV